LLEITNPDRDAKYKTTRRSVSHPLVGPKRIDKMCDISGAAVLETITTIKSAALPEASLGAFSIYSPMLLIATPIVIKLGCAVQYSIAYSEFISGGFFEQPH
jgi:hypothetical protein